MIPQSVQSLIAKLQQEGVRVIIGGGLAVNAHGFPRSTLDADLIVPRSRRQRAEALMLETGFSPKGSTNVATRFSHPNYQVPIVDLLWTDDATFQVFASEALALSDDCRTLSLPHLVAMKIHGIAQSPDRFAKDSEDIRWLLKDHPSEVPLDHYQELLHQFASSQSLDYLLELHPNHE